MVWDFNNFIKIYRTHKTTIQYIVVFLLGFLLARAVFFSVAAPFFLPFWAYMLVHYKKYSAIALVGGIIGALTFNIGQFFILLMQFSIARLLLHFLFRKVPLVVLITTATFLGQAVWQVVYYSNIPSTEVIMAIFLEIILTILFSITIEKCHQVWKQKTWKEWPMEQLVFMSLFIAIVIQGAEQIQIGQVNLSLVFIQFMICFAAFQSTATTTLVLGSVIGIVNAVSNLAFSTMISVVVVTSMAAILAKMYGKLGITVVSIIPSLIFFLYDTTLPLDIVYFSSIGLGAFIFYFATPNDVWSPIGSSNMPNIKQPKQYNAELPVQQFQKMFQLIYEMLQKQSEQQRATSTAKQKGMPLCQSCIRYSYCFEKNENDMEALLTNWRFYQQTNKSSERLKTEQLINKKCMKPNALIEELSFASLNERLNLQFHHGREMFSLQLKDFIKHMEQMMYELQHSDSSVRSLMVKHRDGQPRFEYAYHAYTKTKLKGSKSGDSYKIYSLTDQLVAILLSDGMGHSLKSNQESERIVTYMQQFMKYSIQPETAMHTLHYLYAFQNHDDMYATLDVGMIDLQEGKYYCWKAGCMSTYIVRQNEIFKLNSFSPPIGAMPQFYVEMGTHELKSNDMIFIVSDGIFSFDKNIKEQEDMLMRIILELIERKLPVRTLLYELMDRYEYHYPLTDDCTIIAMEVKHIEQSWQVIHPYAIQT
jgi:stage II sporulation protein E